MRRLRDISSKNDDLEPSIRGTHVLNFDRSRVHRTKHSLRWETLAKHDVRGHGVLRPSDNYGGIVLYRGSGGESTKSQESSARLEKLAL